MYHSCCFSCCFVVVVVFAQFRSELLQREHETLCVMANLPADHTTGYIDPIW